MLDEELRIMIWKETCYVLLYLSMIFPTETSISRGNEDLLLQLSTLDRQEVKATKRCNVRKEFTFMSLAERTRYVQAYKKITTTEPFKTRYEALVFDHPKLAIYVHTVEQFLPWHRLMLLKLEKLLQKVDPRVTLPYWDWSLVHLSPWRTSTLDIWTGLPWGLGGDGDPITGCVKNGPFASDKWSIKTSNGGTTCLRRKFNGILPGIVTIHRALRYETANFTQFEDYIRNFIHDVLHWRISGTMGDKYGSRAPEFMLHHAFLDKIWSDYQKLSSGHKWVYFSGTKHHIYNTDILAKDVVDNDNILGSKICYQDPFESYSEIHRTLRAYSLKDIRKMMTKKAFAPPYFENYINN